MAEIGDRNLLFGILALQLDFIKSDELIQAGNAWMVAKSNSLGEIMVQRGALSQEDRNFVEQIVDKHVARTGSPTKSLNRLQEVQSCNDTGIFLEKLQSQGSATVPGELGINNLAATELLPSRQSSSNQRFKVVRSLARGGLGQVSVARDTELDREVAFKEILENKADSADARERFMSEAKITGGLEHPGIVPIYGLGIEKNGRPYYAMRLIRGKSLHREIESLYQAVPHKRKFNQIDPVLIRRVIRCIGDAANAVAYAHSRGVLHRDLKPSNIMLGKFGETLVVDWGLAKVVGSSLDSIVQSEPTLQDKRSGNSSVTMVGAVVGSPGFMSPEQASGRLDLLDRRSDVFGLGACLYAVLTNQVPFHRSTREETIQATRDWELNEPRQIDATIPKSLEAICLKAMSPKKDDRYDSCSEFAEDLDRWIAGEPVMACIEPLSQRIGRWARKHQTFVVSTIVFFVACLLALIYTNTAIRQQRDIAREQRDLADGLRVIANEATTVASRERDLSDTLRKQADEESAKATQSRNATLEIVEQFVKTLADDSWSRFPQFEKERMGMVDLAVQRIEELHAFAPGDHAIRRQLISMTTRSAMLHRMVGELDEAKKLSDRAKVLVDDFQADSLTGYQIINDTLAEYLNLLIRQVAPEKVLPVADRGVSISRKRIELAPQSYVSKFALARSLMQQAEMWLELERYDEAMVGVSEAIEILGIDKIPIKPEFVVGIFHFHCLQMRATIHLYQKNTVAAREDFNAALKVADRWMTESNKNNNVVQYRQSLIIDIAKMELSGGDKEQGLQMLLESRAVFEQLIKDLPDTKDYQRLLAELDLTIAEYSVQKDDLVLADQYLSTAISFIQSYPQPEQSPAIYLPLKLRAAALKLKIAEPEQTNQLRPQYEEARSELEAFFPKSKVLRETENMVTSVD